MATALTHRHKQMPERMATADLHALEKVAPLLQEARLVGPLQLREQRFQQRSAALDELSSLGQELQGEAA